jgi:hypothetical protein
MSSLAELTSANIPRTIFTSFSKAGLGVELVLPQGTVTFDQEAVASLAKQVWNRHITVEIDDDGEVIIKSGRRVIKNIAGKIEVK